MRIRPEDNLTEELAALGIPNPFPDLEISRNDSTRLFGRAYVGWMKVSDTVITPHGQELYSRCADGDVDTSLSFDATGENSQRPTPPEGYIYAVVQSPTYSLFWERVQAAINLRVEGDAFILSDEFAATYGLPADAKQILEPDQATS